MNLVSETSCTTGIVQDLLLLSRSLKLHLSVRLFFTSKSVVDSSHYCSRAWNAHAFRPIMTRNIKKENANFQFDTMVCENSILQ